MSHFNIEKMLKYYIVSMLIACCMYNQHAINRKQVEFQRLINGDFTL